MDALIYHMNKSINCPLCGQANLQNLLNLSTANFDQSSLYDEIRICACLGCGHIFNDLSEADLEGLAGYYREEKALSNTNSPEKIGDIPGSNNPETIKRYQRIFDFIKPYLTTESTILDLGFSKGGFVNFLAAQGYSSGLSIDVVDRFLGQAKDLNLPELPDHSLDIIAIDQTMEHLANPLQAFQEFKRLLKPSGVLFIGIPDAGRYEQDYFFDFYWFLLKEHVQHFDLTHISLLAARSNFSLVDKVENYTVMMNTTTMLLPNLNLLFKLEDASVDLEQEISDKHFALLPKIERYIATNLIKLTKRQEFFSQLAREEKSLYIWGIGREFFYLYEAAGLKHCQIKGLIDANVYKQENLQVDGLPIQSNLVLADSKDSDSLLITAVAHSDLIKAAVKQKNYPASFVDFIR